jgi:hypothetical protein
MDFDSIGVSDLFINLATDIISYSSLSIQFSVDQLTLISQAERFILVLKFGLQQRFLGLKVLIGLNNVSILNIMESQLNKLTVVMDVTGEPFDTWDSMYETLAVDLYNITIIMRTTGKWRSIKIHGIFFSVFF